MIGIVYDEATGSPLANASVVVVDSDGKQYAITTDGNGGFSMNKEQILINKSFRVDVSKDQYFDSNEYVHSSQIQ